MIETMKVKPWGKDQGEFVVINAEDFDPKIHTAFGAPGKPGTFDHDGDGRPGGSLKGKKSTAAKGARRRKGK